MVEQCGIYMIQSPSGGTYIGSSVRLVKRKARHFSDLRHNRHHCEGLQRAWNKYNGDLKFTVLEHCTSENLIQREQWWIDYIRGSKNKLYNARHTADTNGHPLQQSTKDKIAFAHRGRKLSEETKQKMRRPKTSEHSAAISAGKKGRSNGIIWTDSEREKRRIATKAQWDTGRREPARLKIKASWNDERRRKHSAGFERRRVLKHMEMVNWMMGG